MNTKWIIFGVLYFGLLIWGFLCGRNSVFDNWFNDIIWQPVLDENGNPIVTEENVEDIDDNLTDEEQIEFLKTLIEASQEKLKEVEERMNKEKKS